MGKDKSGKYHPSKGKPSGSGKEEGVGLKSTNSKDIDTYLKIADKYTDSEEEPAANLHVRHKNRNVSKGEDHFLENIESENSANSNESVSVRTHQLEEKTLSIQFFGELAEFQASPCISIYLPTHPAGVEVNEQ